MPFNASSFRQQLQFGGARPNLFEVTMAFPSYVVNASGAGEKVTFHCKATSLPGSNVGNIEVPYFGRKIKVAGDRNFEDWTITVINDEDFIVRNAFESWQDGISQLDFDTDLVRRPEAAGINAYIADIVAKQYSKGGEVIKTYNIKNAFPITVDPIELSWENENQIEEFGVTFSFDYFTTDLGG